MKIIVAPDSFKGSISAFDFCNAVKAAAETSAMKPTLCMMPMADGGEGTAKSLISVLGGELLSCTVKGPCGNDVTAHVGFTDGGRRAVIECAEAVGMHLAKQGSSPATTSTYGIGQMISFATAKGAGEIILALGGSSTNDCGVGMLSAMGVRFTDICGNILEPVGATLARIETIDYKNTFEKYRGVHFTVLTDVENPLLGKNGCANVFAPQKGADGKTVKALEDGAARFANIVKRVTCSDHSQDAGAGAAGGLGFACAAFLGASLTNGADTLLDLYGFDKEASDCDAVITGEGCFDSQSLMGKAVGRIITRSSDAPVDVFCGISKSPDTKSFRNLRKVHQISPSDSAEYTERKAALENLGKALEGYFASL